MWFNRILKLDVSNKTLTPVTPTFYLSGTLLYLYYVILVSSKNTVHANSECN